MDAEHFVRKFPHSTTTLPFLWTATSFTNGRRATGRNTVPSRLEVWKATRREACDDDALRPLLERASLVVASKGQTARARSDDDHLPVGLGKQVDDARVIELGHDPPLVTERPVEASVGQVAREPEAEGTPEMNVRIRGAGTAARFLAEQLPSEHDATVRKGRHGGRHS